MPDTNTTIPVRATASADPGAPWWVALLAGAVALIAGLGRRRHPAWRAAPDVPANLASFSRHLRAENKAPSTIVTYSKAVTQLDAFLERSHRPRAVAELRREDVEAFHLDLQVFILINTSSNVLVRALVRNVRKLRCLREDQISFLGLIN